MPAYSLLTSNKVLSTPSAGSKLSCTTMDRQSKNQGDHQNVISSIPTLAIE
jgi:hypothetical protein